MRHIHPKIIQAVKKFKDESIPITIPRELPLLEKLRTTFSSINSFSGTDILFIQHHLGPFIPRLELMVDSGLDRNRCWFVDIPYSTNKLVKSELITRGFPQDQQTELFTDPLATYLESQRNRVESLLVKIEKRNNPGKLLVIDDGAYFIRYLHRMMEKNSSLVDKFQRSYVVEQTTRGHRFIVGPGRKVIKKLELYVVSIARCKTKIEFEAPFIGAAVTHALSREIGEDKLSSVNEIALIGYGAIGKTVLPLILQKNKNALVDIVDIDSQVLSRTIASESRCKTMTRLRDNAQYDLVIGCTGKNSFGIEQRKLLSSNAVLASGSSADVEFSRSKFIELADRYPDDDIEVINRNKVIDQGIHFPIEIREGNKIFTFLNAGFPINFDGRIEHLPLRMIQPTHCLLFAAAEQVLNQRNFGFSNIDPEIDGWIYDNAISDL